MRAVGLGLYFYLLITGIAAGQSFTCPWGKDAACLDYGAKVCSNLGKCVDQNAICFDSFTCNFQGFVCKSDYEELVDELDEKVRLYNRLARDFSDLQDDNLQLVSQTAGLQQTIEDISDCLSFADSIDDARLCAQ